MKMKKLKSWTLTSILFKKYRALIQEKKPL